MAPSRSFAIVFSLSLVAVAEAWLPCNTCVSRKAGVQLADKADSRAIRAVSGVKASPSTLLKAVEEASGAASRSDLRKMKQGFERSMDSGRVMDYVKELRERKRLLLSRLEETGGIITDDIYPIMEELALVNPSGGCGQGSDKGRDHYNAMLLGHWISASTIIATVPYVYGEGEPGPSSTYLPRSQLPSNGSGPTCTLGHLALAVSGRECRDEAFDPSAAVRPLRARLSALANTVAKGQMPTVVLVAGFAPASKALRPPAEEEEKRKEAGAVRARGRWAALGENHLRWEFETVNVDLGGDRIVKVGPKAFQGQGGVAVEGNEEGGHDLYEFFLDQDMFIMAWKGDSPRAEDAVVFVRDEIPRRF